VSGMELGPAVANRRRASSLVRPFDVALAEVLTTGAVTLGTGGINAGARFSLNQSAINAISHGKFDDRGPGQRKIFARDFAFNDGVAADFTQIDLVGLFVNVSIVPKIFQLLLQQFLVSRAIAGSDIGRT